MAARQGPGPGRDWTGPGTLVEGLRVVTVLLHPYLPAATGRLLEALGTPDLALAGAVLGRRGGRDGGRDRAAVPEGRDVIDSHTDLDQCAVPAGPARLSARGVSLRCIHYT